MGSADKSVCLKHVLVFKLGVGLAPNIESAVGSTISISPTVLPTEPHRESAQSNFYLITDVRSTEIRFSRRRLCPESSFESWYQLKQWFRPRLGLCPTNSLSSQPTKTLSESRIDTWVLQRPLYSSIGTTSASCWQARSHCQQRCTCQLRGC